MNVNDIINENFKIDFNTLFFEITSVCNSNCTHCYNSSFGKNYYLELGMIEKAVNSLDNDKLKNVILSGGEALLHPQIWEIIEYLYKKGIGISILSNGYLLNEFIIDRLKVFDVHIQISLDGADKQINDMIREDGSFEKAYNALSLLKQLEHNRKTSINTVINYHNYNTIENIYNLAKYFDVLELGFNFIQLQGSASSNGYKGLDTEIKTILNELEKLYNKNDIVKRIIKPSLSCRFCNPINNIIFLTPLISYTGNVYACEAFNNDMFSLGNINHNALSEILSSMKLKQILMILNLRKYYMGKCRSCFVKDICNGGCPAISVNQTNNIFDNGNGCDLYKNFSVYELERKKV